MAKLQAIRNKRHDSSFMQNIIHTVWDAPDVVNRWSCGVLNTTSEMICHMFHLTQNAWGKGIFVKIHCFIMDFEDDNDYETIMQIINSILQRFQNDYQVIATLQQDE